MYTYILKSIDVTLGVWAYAVGTNLDRIFYCITIYIHVVQNLRLVPEKLNFTVLLDVVSAYGKAKKKNVKEQKFRSLPEI